MQKILIVEDDPVIAKEVKTHLEKWGYEVFVVDDFRDVLSSFMMYEPELVLLDIILPYYNGFHWCTEIRKQSKVPIVFLSSADDNMNIVMAMNMGGDDFIEKPFDLSVLTAKIQAVLRRTYSPSPQMNMIEWDGVTLNLSDTTVYFSGKTVELTKNEYKILQILMEQAGSVVKREDIMNALWVSDSFVDDNTLTVNITRLRKKLYDIGLPDFISTKKGIGYMVG